MFLSVEKQGGNWIFGYSPDRTDFERGLDGQPPGSTEAAAHAAATSGMGSNKLTCNRRGRVEDIPRKKANSNNDQARAGKYIEPGVYEIIVTPDELTDYLQGLDGVANSPTFAYVIANTNADHMAQDVAMAKMIWLARYLDPEHDVDTYPPGVKLSMSDFQAMQQARMRIREGGRTLGELMTTAMGPDWEEKLKAAQGHPIRPTRTLPWS